MSQQPGERVPRLLWERAALDELSPDEQDSLEGRLASDGPDHLDAIARSNEEILTAYPPAVMAACISEQLEARRRRRRLLWLAVPVAAAAAVLLLTLVLPLIQSGTVTLPPSGKVEPTRAKGEPMIFVFRKRGQRAEELRVGNTVFAGDLLQITYTASGARHGVIFSVDGRGKLTLHYPDAKEKSTALAAEGPHALPFSYELDDAPQLERFFFVTSKTPVDVEAVLARARQALTAHPDGPLRLPGLRIKELSLKKGHR